MYIDIFQEKFIQECQWSAHEEALTLCREYKLHQAVYFLQRDLAFMREVHALTIILHFIVLCILFIIIKLILIPYSKLLLNLLCLKNYL